MLGWKKFVRILLWEEGSNSSITNGDYKMACDRWNWYGYVSSIEQACLCVLAVDKLLNDFKFFWQAISSKSSMRWIHSPLFLSKPCQFSQVTRLPNTTSFNHLSILAIVKKSSNRQLFRRITSFLTIIAHSILNLVLSKILKSFCRERELWICLFCLSKRKYSRCCS